MNSFKKIFIDSRFAISGSGSDFIYDLGQTIELPENARVAVTNISIPHSFYPISLGINDRLYFICETNIATPLADTQYITVSPGSYDAASICTEIQTKLNAHAAATGDYNDFVWAVTYSTTTGKITIVNNETPTPENFHIFSNKELTALYGNPFHQGIGEVLSILDITFAASQLYTSYATKVINIMNLHNIFLRCPELAGFNNVLDGLGRQDIIKKLHINQDWGYMVYENQSLNDDDFIKIPEKSLRILHFQLTDYLARVVDLQAQHISFSIIFKYDD